MAGRPVTEIHYLLSSRSWSLGRRPGPIHRADPAQHIPRMYSEGVPPPPRPPKDGVDDPAPWGSSAHTLTLTCSATQNPVQTGLPPQPRGHTEHRSPSTCRWAHNPGPGRTAQTFSPAKRTQGRDTPDLLTFPARSCASLTPHSLLAVARPHTALSRAGG